eukprot:CAMPEP_0175095284 /NCGR_PEP_ID=MMETSP0086_2-20121207/4064_1 /TAXON_ID=136419 /ORGANISM="Unknown Unknown, Strain D1" /LENGTH=324 /DNA_ID=CAMNT_0016368503 /DNA_START=56 /DNA_END=1027 /DNA_ORIENTATION=-
MTKLRIQIASDLHLEMFGSWKAVTRKIKGHKNFQRSAGPPLITPSAPILALLGDIGCPATDMESYKNFLNEMADRFEHVIVLAGNHEFYQTHWRQSAAPLTCSEIKQVIQCLCDKRPNLHFLDRKSIVLNGIRICGATLWSDIDAHNTKAVSQSLNDYRLCYSEGKTVVPMPCLPGQEQKWKTMPVRTLTVQDTVTWHKQDVAWLQSELELARDEGQQCVFLTHHAPSLINTSHPKHAGSPINSAFATSLEWMFDTQQTSSRCNEESKQMSQSNGSVAKQQSQNPYNPLCVWAFGHTHFNTDYLSAGVRIVANQFGYVNCEPAW